MTILVTGSAGHLGEALMRTLRAAGRPVRGLDILASPFTDSVGSVADRDVVRRCMAGIDVVLHAATLHKPHVATHGRQDFVDVNVSGTLNLLEEALAAGVQSFVFTSTTSVFGNALVPPPASPAAWIDESVVPVPKNIYGVTKAAAEDLCQLFARDHGLPVVVLRTSRFFPKDDDNRDVRDAFAGDNAKASEFLHRRVEIEDVVEAHLLAAERAPSLGFRRYIVSATTPFRREDLPELRRDAAAVIDRLVPEAAAEYARRGWALPASLDRVYVNEQARRELGWRPRHDFAAVIARLAAGGELMSPLARQIGLKGYHAERFADGPYPVAC